MFRNIICALFLLITTILFLSIAYDFLASATDITDHVFPVLSTLVVALIDLFIIRYMMSGNRLNFGLLLLTTILFASSSTMAIFIVASSYANYQLKDRSYAGVYDNCNKVWAARGLVLEGPSITHDGMQNSIESIQRAFDRGAKGTEVDVIFDTERGEFIVSHDLPYHLKNGVLLTLEALFEATAESGYFWLDFKKLRHLDDKQLAQSVSELERLASKKGLKRRIYVEGEAPFSLAAYRDAGFNTIFDSHPLPDSNPLTPTIINLYKMFFYFGDFSVMAMNYGDTDDPFYGQRTRQSLGKIPVFIYHVQDNSDVLKVLSSLAAVRVILPQNHSLDLYHINACPDNG